MELQRGIAFVKRRVGPRFSLFAKMNGLIIILFIPIGFELLVVATAEVAQDSKR
ncbi:MULTISPECIES: hypothetical protein [unclassified Paenibacillus]|uniref:hypothetical protein n=1 Tax=unclassified Paenibacillus TaxID=185978 RepID=UPI00278A1A4B|nr:MULTISPECIES: hypothetical protein [unclassified Paenibacillus]MDQ0897145.1 hypothetical protein [Paenibacillus sp. V4I7]MDQ0916706.1 hypothetical protein [Paenibacillus sp. V4I5]